MMMMVKMMMNSGISASIAKHKTNVEFNFIANDSKINALDIMNKEIVKYQG